MIVDDEATLQRKHGIAHVILRPDGRRVAEFLGPPGTGRISNVGTITDDTIRVRMLDRVLP